MLALALLVGWVRLWRLGTWSLWIDEAYTVADWSRAADEGRLWNPLGYRAIRATVELLGGEPEAWNLRLLPALAGWACVPLAAWCFRPAAGGRRAAWIALLLALSSWHVFWSQSARFYTLAMATSLLGSGLTLRGLYGGRTGLAMAGLVVASLAAAFHPTALMVVPVLALAPWVVGARGASPGAGFDRTGRWLSRAAFLGAGAGALVLGPALLGHVSEKGTADPVAGPAHLALTCGFFFTPVVLAAGAWGGWRAWRERAPLGILALVVCLGVGLTALGLGTVSLMTAQYVFCLLPWALVLATEPVGLVEHRPRLAAGWLAVLLVSAAGNLSLYLTSRRGERPRWEEAYRYVEAKRSSGDLVLGMAAPIGELYLGGTEADPRRTRAVSPLGDWFPEGPQRWARHPRRIWIVVRPQWLDSLRESDRSRLERWLAGECRLVRRLPVEMEGRDLDLAVYLREP